MIRGTTPTLKFGIPFDTDLIATGFITFNQNGITILEKDMSACSFEDRRIVLHLTQADTLAFKEEEQVDIQVRLKTTDDEALASNIIRVLAKGILKDGQI